MNKEKMKIEALKRMKLLKLHKNVIADFKDYNIINRSETDLGLLYWLSDYEKNIVKEFQKKNNSLVYHIIKTATKEYGTVYDLLYVSDEELYWKVEEQDIRDSFVLSYTISEYSEIGIIKIKSKNGGIIRMY